MDNVLADIDIDDPTAHVNGAVETGDVAPRAIQKQEKRKKDKKKNKTELKDKKAVDGADGEKKKRKRKHSEVDDEMTTQSSKQVKA